jgi:hypothetical protein
MILRQTALKKAQALLLGPADMGCGSSRGAEEEVAAPAPAAAAAAVVAGSPAGKNATPKKVYQKKSPFKRKTPTPKKQQQQQPCKDPHAAYLAETQEMRKALVSQFEQATAGIMGASPLKEFFLQVGNSSSGITELSLDDQLSLEFRGWLPARQGAALRLLSYNPFIAAVKLNGLALDDSVGTVLADVLRRNRAITSLSVERNDLREAGLLALVDALRSNTTLRELRINHQKFTVTTPVEEALHEILHQKHNTTLLKLGLVVRNDVPRNRIDAALMANIDSQRVARQESRKSAGGADSSSNAAAYGGDAVPAARSLASVMSGGGDGGGREHTRKRQLSSKLAGMAAGLEGTLAPFDVDAVISDLRANTVPSTLCEAGTSDSLVLNNDVKFARVLTSQKEDVIKALRANTKVRSVQMANVQLGDTAAKLFADVLRENKHLTSLNLEGNLIASTGISALAEALADEDNALVELKLDHQVGSVCSATAEMELARAVEKHPRLQKLSYSMRNVQSRDIVEKALMRNRDSKRIERQISKRANNADGAAQQARV